MKKEENINTKTENLVSYQVVTTEFGETANFKGSNQKEQKRKTL